MPLPFLLGALCALLAYLAAVLLVAGVRAHRTDREWTLLHERGDIPTWLYEHLRA